MGFLVGAASVGIGMGVMQIPQEQRTNVRNHAATSFEKVRDVACTLGDSFGCAGFVGLVDPRGAVGRALPEEITICCGKGGGYVGDNDGDGVWGERGVGGSGHGGGGYCRGGTGDHCRDDGPSILGGDQANAFEVEGSPITNAVTGAERGMTRLVGDVFGEELPSPVSAIGAGDGRGVGNSGGGNGNDHLSANDTDDATGRRAACGRKGKFKTKKTHIHRHTQVN